MNLINIEKAEKNFIGRQLLDQTDFYLHEGEKVGIIGVNGSGKSTLLRIIAGCEELDAGTYVKANHIVISYLPQNPEFDPEETVLASATKGTENADNIEAIRADAKAMLLELGIHEFDKKTVLLSGGQRKKVALVRVLSVPADVIVLDEPTNHLDLEMNEFLEEKLKKLKAALVMVTHDRYFLDAVTNSIVELDQGKLYSYHTNYTGFLELKTQREEMLLASERKRKSILRTELEWIRRGARARSTKQKARIERYEEMKNVQDFKEQGKVEMGSISSRLGRSIIELQHINKSYDGRTLIKDFDYIFLKNDRIGFVGSNGSGKTTLMKMIIGQVQPDAGEILIGQTVKIGYYSQEMERDSNAGIAYMDPKMRVIDYIKETAEYVRTEDGLISASQMLERFLFTPQMQYTFIEKLSGGEKRRLNLLRVLMEAPNVLILDEPTNDLDIATLTILEDFLDHFQGVVIIVSHDRYFLDRTVRRIFAFEGDGRISQYEGGYTDYWNKVGKKQSAVNVATPSKKEGEASGNSKVTWKQREKKLKFTYQEQKDFEVIEEEIAALEEKLADLEKEEIAVASDYVKLATVTKKKEEVETKLLEKMDRWAYLEELAEKIKNQ